MNKALHKLLLLFMPDVDAHFTRHSITVDFFATPWFMTFFGASHPLPLSFRLIDLIMCGENPVCLMLGAAVCMVAHNEHDILRICDFEELAVFLKNELLLSFDASASPEHSVVKIIEDEIRNWKVIIEEHMVLNHLDGLEFWSDLPQLTPKQQEYLCRKPRTVSRCIPITIGLTRILQLPATECYFYQYRHAKHSKVVFDAAKASDIYP